MVGIKSIGVYIPYYRIKKEVINKSWGKVGGKGEIAVPNFDEDTVTMATEAVFNCLEEEDGKGKDRKNIEGLYFSSTTLPYAEKQASNFIAYISELNREVSLYDFSSGITSATQALTSAINAIEGGCEKENLVVSSDIRMGEPGSEEELNSGAAAVSIWLGKDDLIAEIIDRYTISEEFVDIWRKRGDNFIQTSDTTFTTPFGYQRILKESIWGLLKKSSLKIEDISLFLFPANSLRDYQKVSKSLGVKDSQVVEDGLLNQFGNCGSASPFLLLAWAQDMSKSGDLIVIASYGSGESSAFLLKIIKPKVYPEFKHFLKNKGYLQSYQKFLKFKEVLKEKPIEPFSSTAMLYRERRQNFQLYAVRCQNCKTVYFPQKIICHKCGKKDSNNEFKLKKEGKIYTYTKDILYPTPNPPNITAVCELEGGGRFYGQVTDCEPDKIKIGLPVKLTLRQLHEGGGFYNYFWKIKPKE